MDLGLERAGMRCAWQVEIDPQARAVLRRHWPDVDLHEDVNNVGPSSLAPVDLICGGFPCQDLSVAGRRAGLDGERSGLWYEFHRIVAECAPRWVLIENVPGLLSGCGCISCRSAARIRRIHRRVRERSGAVECDLCHALAGLLASHTGRNMAVVLHGLAQLGYVGAWRVLDSQYFGVAQRRHRVFVLATRDPGAPCPGEILAIPEGLSGHPAPRREAGEGTTGNSDGGAYTAGSHGGYRRGVGTLRSNGGDIGGWSETLIANTPPTKYRGDPHEGTNTIVTHTLRAEGFDASERCEISGCGNRRHAHGLCSSHYNRLRRHGDPLAGRVAEGEPLAFLLSHVGHEGDGCVPWPYATLATGYGSVRYEGKTTRAHRLICELANGPPPESDLEAAHSCGVRGCINPNHLRWATKAENMADAVGHGTFPRGEQHGASKLSEADVLEVLSRLELGDTHQSIADDLGVSRNAITDIANGKNWGWLTERRAGTGRGTPLVAQTITAEMYRSGGAVAGNNNAGVRNVMLVPFDTTQITSKANYSNPKAGDPCHPLAAGAHAPAVTTTIPRRLTVTECERLQAFPDGWTEWGIDDGGARVEMADGPRYRMLGNAVTVNVVSWIGKHLATPEREEPDV